MAVSFMGRSKLPNSSDKTRNFLIARCRRSYPHMVHAIHAHPTGTKKRTSSTNACVNYCLLKSHNGTDHETSAPIEFIKRQVSYWQLNQDFNISWFSFSRCIMSISPNLLSWERIASFCFNHPQLLQIPWLNACHTCLGPDNQGTSKALSDQYISTNLTCPLMHAALKHPVIRQ